MSERRKPTDEPAKPEPLDQRKPTAFIRFVCWFSRRYFDIHDYKRAWGGDGFPTHFYEYTCWNCRKRFHI